MSNDFMSTDDELNNGVFGQNTDDDIVLDLTGEDLTTTRKPIAIGTWLRVAVYEAEVKPSKSEKNKGKPVYHITLKVLGGEAKGRQFTIYAPLWSGAFFTAFKFFKALGYNMPKPPAEGERINFKVPGKSKLLGSTLEAKVTAHEEGNKTDDDGNPILFERLGAFRPMSDEDEDLDYGDGLDEFASGDGGLFS